MSRLPDLRREAALIAEGLDQDDNDALPEGWCWATLGAVCHINPRRADVRHLSNDLPVSFVPMAAVDAESGSITAGEVRPFHEVRKGYTAFRDGDVIFAKITPCMENGKAAIASGLENGLGFGSTEFHVLRPTSAVLAEYVWYFVRQALFRERAAPHMTGTVGQKRLPADYLESYPLPLPPLPEQRRIVAALGAALARVNAARERLARVPAVLKRYRAAVLAAAVEGRLTEDWRAANPAPAEDGPALLRRILAERRARWQEAERERYRKAGKTLPLTWRDRYQEPVGPDTAELPELPEGWTWATVEQVLSEPMANGRSVPDASEGFPVLRLSSIRKGSVDLSERKIGAWSAAEAHRFLVQCGDFLVVRGNGSLDLVGRGGLVDKEPDPVAYPDTLIRMRLIQSLVGARFLRFIWDAAPVRRQIETAAHTTAGIHKVSQQDLSVIVFPVPPLQEQSEIITRIERCLGLEDKADYQVNRASQLMDSLARSVLAKAFRGELAPQDPADEPAAVAVARAAGQSPATPPGRGRRQPPNTGQRP